MKTKIAYLTIFSVALFIVFFATRKTEKNKETKKNDASITHAYAEKTQRTQLKHSENIENDQLYRLKNLARGIQENLIDSRNNADHDNERPVSDLVEYLEEMSEDEAENVQWTDKTKVAVAQRLFDDPEIELGKVKCTDIFCTVLMSKPIESLMDWQEVDDRLADVTRGHTIMQATPNGDGTTTARLFFSAENTRLPL